jgi:hypothetical protein
MPHQKTIHHLLNRPPARFKPKSLLRKTPSRTNTQGATSGSGSRTGIVEFIAGELLIDTTPPPARKKSSLPHEHLNLANVSALGIQENDPETSRLSRAIGASLARVVAVVPGLSQPLPQRGDRRIGTLLGGRKPVCAMSR